MQKHYCRQESKVFYIFPHTMASNVVFRQKYILSEKRLPLSCHTNSSQIFDATKLWKYTIPLTYNTKTLISNISETRRFSPQMRLIAYPDHKTTRYSKNCGSLAHVTRLKVAVNMADPTCPLDTIRTLKSLLRVIGLVSNTKSVVDFYEALECHLISGEARLSTLSAQERNISSIFPHSAIFSLIFSPIFLHFSPRFGPPSWWLDRPLHFIVISLAG